MNSPGIKGIKCVTERRKIKVHVVFYTHTKKKRNIKNEKKMWLGYYIVRTETEIS